MGDGNEGVKVEEGAGGGGGGGKWPSAGAAGEEVKGPVTAAGLANAAARAAASGARRELMEYLRLRRKG